MEFGDLKKAFWVLVIIIAGAWYVRSHYTFQDVLAYSHAHPNKDWSPKIDYYSGMFCVMTENYPTAIEAFTQLLTDYPTCQYAEAGMFRLGVTQIELSRWGDARDTFTKYIEDFPEGKNRKAVDEKYEYIKFR